MDVTLAKSELDKEDSDVEEHMSGHRDRPHSRDDAGVGLPAAWNRRKRIKQDDPDMKSPVEQDKDLSLNYKYADGEEKTENLSSRLNKLAKRMEKIGPGFSKGFKQKRQEIEDQSKSDMREASIVLDEAEHSVDESSSIFSGAFASYTDIVQAASAAWFGNKDFYIRAGIVEALKKAAMKTELPNSVKIPVLNTFGERISDLESIKAILSSDKKIENVSDKSIDAFVEMAIAYRFLRNNPKRVSPGDMVSEKVSATIRDQMKSIRNLVDMASSWDDIMEKFARSTKDDENHVSNGDWDAMAKKMESFLRRGKSSVDPDKYMQVLAERMVGQYGSIPDEVLNIFKGYGIDMGKLRKKHSSDMSTSYRTVSRRMDSKLSAYHGIVYQGHPTDSAGSSSAKYDKRYFGKEHYDAILASAEEFLKTDWFKFGWGDNPGDAPMRAALDLAIGTADNGLYQSKIDAPTYTMLLNRLAGWDYDVFNETVFARPKAGKTASMENSPLREILKIADDLRSSNPDLAVQIVKNVHALSRQIAADPASVDQGQQGEAFRSKEERDLIKKVILQMYADKKIQPPTSSDLNKQIDEIEKAFDDVLNEKTKLSSSDLRVAINLAAEVPKYKKLCSFIVAHVAASIGKKEKPAKGGKKGKPAKGKGKPAKGDKKEKEKETPDPSIPVKKDNKKSKPKKASTPIVASDINW